MKFLAFVLALATLAGPAFAGPAAILPAIAIGVGVAGGIGFGSFAIGATLALATSFVAQALFRPRGGDTAAPTTQPRQTTSQRVTIENKQSIRQATAPRRIIYGRARVGGTYGFMHTTQTNQNLWCTIMFAGHLIWSFRGILFDDELLPIDPDGHVRSGRYANAVLVEFRNGHTPQAALPIFLNSGLLNDKWNATMRGDGIAYAGFRLTWDNQSGAGDIGQKIWSGGLPNVTAVIDGKIVFDPRLGTNVFSSNAALVICDYLLDDQYGLGVEYATGINIPALIAAANACDEAIVGADGQVRGRYTINGSFPSDANPDEVLGKMAAAMHGKIIYDGNQWTILAGVYIAPDNELTDDDMVEPSTVITLTSARDSYNSVKGTCTDGRSILYPTRDFPAIVSDTFRAQDNGWFREKDIELPLTNDLNTAQRIAKIDLLRNRQEVIETFIGRPICWRIRAGDTILRHSERYGWSSKPFEVQSVRFVSRAGEGGEGPRLCVELVLQETDPSIYEWSTSEEQVIDPAPNTDFPNPFVVAPPGAITAIEELYVSRQGGGVKSALKLSWVRSPDAFVREYEVWHSPAGLDEWIVRARTTQLIDEIPDLAPGEYDIRVYARNWAGAMSEPATKRVSVYGVIAPPATPQNLTATTIGGYVFLRWDRATELDVLEGGSVIVRHSSSFADPLWAEATMMARPLPGNETTIAVPARLGTYMVKFRDATGNYSPEPAKVLGFQNSVHQFSALDAVIEDPTFAGTKTNMTVDAGDLVLTGPPGINIDSVPDIDALTSFDNYAVGFPPGEYLFADRIDLGAVTRCRLTAVMSSIVFAITDMIDARSQTIDEWTSIDGDVTGDEADAEIWVRWTDDDPAGAAVWSDWQRLDSAEFENRAFEFKLTATRTSETVSIAIAELAVFAEEVV